MSIFKVLRELHWLPVSYWIDFKILLLFVFKALHGTAPSYIVDLIQAKKSKIVFRSESSSLFEYDERRPLLVKSGSAPLLGSLNDV